MAGVDFVDVRKSFGAFPVIKGVNIEIEDGEFVILVGPSGCGKSTLLRMLAGLENITAGEIRIGNQVVNRLPPKDRDIAMVFQNYALYPHMTVADNMAFSLMLASRPKSEIDKRVGVAAEILGLAKLLDRYPRQLSGGQRQRVAIGRALVRKPQVFLFDEPLSNLDAKLRMEMRTELKRLHQMLGTTIVYVTHDQIEAMTLATRIAVMRNGRIEQLGTPEDVYDHPATLYVAGFVGSPPMNVLDGVVTGEGLRLDGSGQVVALPARFKVVTVGQRVKIGVRPEALRLAGDGAEQKSLDVEIEVVELTGPELVVTGRASGQRVTACLPPRTKLAVGAKQAFAFDEDSLHLFDAESELALG